MQAKLFISPRFAIRRLGNEIALFNLQSGETHLISQPASTVLELLVEAPRSRDMLRTDITPHVEATDPEIDEFIDQTLKQFSEIGLIESPHSS